MAHVTPVRPAPRSLDDVRDPDKDDPYPVWALEGSESAVVFFCARWHGRQDACHIADAGLEGTCVDTDRARLKEMRAVYPDGWYFSEADAFQYAERAYALGHEWDVVSLDPDTNLFDKCSDMLETWCALARNAVVIGTGMFTVVDAPKGWQIKDTVWRSDFVGGVYWTVLVPT
jgi:hypothetical protein